ncbi:uncharacterized protein LY89DRAFT_347254 [Mollisia scopiformis]|uniref:Uncharacterized protein n=1 Tax=Mollisia scopiformis TaxID=149040 RepID=A0A132B6H4_MOLSC|nr:uncharacterized protein LY89DRAFT_347254 [Mollisia scopiformis]KUJ08000.1 hypothetical protein LY89DRAFT_347254 [Mollisia scopiformis]
MNPCILIVSSLFSPSALCLCLLYALYVPSPSFTVGCLVDCRGRVEGRRYRDWGGRSYSRSQVFEVMSRRGRTLSSCRPSPSPLPIPNFSYHFQLLHMLKSSYPRLPPTQDFLLPKTSSYPRLLPTQDFLLPKTSSYSNHPNLPNQKSFPNSNYRIVSKSSHPLLLQTFSKLSFYQYPPSLQIP